jgi:N-acetylneuraminate synthase
MISIVADIGINHNGEMDIIKKLIDVCSVAGINYVKFQKRNPDVCVPEKQKNLIRKTPWGEIPYIEYRYKLELAKEEYIEIDKYCKEKNIGWFASVWDEDSARFMSDFTHIVKIPSAVLTDWRLLSLCRKLFRTVILSTGMSTEIEIEEAVSIGDPDVILHCNSSYPANIEDLNLNYIYWLKDKYGHCEIGYSGHEFGLVTTFVTVGMGVTWIERHVTLDRMMWGSDQLSSIEPDGIFKLVRGIRDIESSLGKIDSRKVCEAEKIKRESLRK